MSTAASTRQIALTVLGTAMVAFLMCAAASAIVTQASGPDARELAVSANSVVATGVDEPVTSAPVGARVPQMVSVPVSALVGDPAERAPAAAGVKTARIGIVEESSSRLAQTLAIKSDEWLAVEQDLATRVGNAAVAAGARLRKRGFVALILPDQYLAEPNACNVAVGLEDGGVIPVIRLNASNPVDFAVAKACLNRLKNRNPTAYVNATNRVQPAVEEAMKSATSIVETTGARLGTSLEAGAAIVSVTDLTRESAVSELTAEDAAVPEAVVGDAARRAADWIAATPTPGVVPATTAAEKKKQEIEELKLKGQRQIDRAQSDPQNDPDEPGRGDDSGKSGGAGPGKGL